MKRRGFLVPIVMALAMTASATAVAAKAPEKPSYTLTILHNNDGESELLPQGDEGELAGVARFQTLVDREKAAAVRGQKGKDNRRGVIMVSSGDNFLASPAFNASLDNGVYYDALALDQIGYDAIALGNHDFDFGPDVLADFISKGFSSPGEPPYLSSNLDVSAEPALQALADSDVIAASTIVKERGERIGIIGATTENLPFISSPRDVVVNAVQPAVQAEIDALQAAGVEIIILISHLQDVQADQALAQTLTGIDVMIAGGGDELLANDGDLLLPTDDEDDVFGPYPVLTTNADGATVPVVTTSGQYGYLGRLVVDFDSEGNVTGWDGGPIRVVDDQRFPDGVAADPVQQALVVDPVAAYVEDLAATVIGVSEVALDGVRSNVRGRETNEGNLLADAQLWQAAQLAATFGVNSPDVALQNGGGIRNDSVIPAGELTELDTFDIAPFGNFVAVVEDVSREQFKEILENAVSRTQAGDLPGGSGRFAQVGGFRFTYSASGTAQQLDADGTVTVAGTRVVEVVLDDGTPIVTGGSVVPGPAINIAIADFLARGGDEYPFRGAPFTTLGVTYQQALSNYIQDGLGGLVSAAAYPEGGEGRIVEVP